MSEIQDPLLAKHLGPQIAKGASIHESCQIGMGAQISAEALIGPEVRIGQFVSVVGAVNIKNAVTVHPYTTLIGPLHIGEGAIIGPGGIIGLNRADTDYSHTQLMDFCRVGRGVQILAGVKLGRHARIRAGSVVIGDVPPYGLAAHNPAVLEGYACPICGKLLSQKHLEGDEVEVHCETCVSGELRFTHKIRLGSINRVLLPHHTLGAHVQPLGTARGWRDEEEIVFS